jgi:DNA-binding NtrC family response regulator
LLVIACGVARLPGARRSSREARLFARAARVSPLCEHEVRRAVAEPAIEAPAHDVIATLEGLLTVVFEAPTEADALARVAEFLRRQLKACTVTVRGARAQSLAMAGRPWPGDAAVVDVVLSGGASFAKEDVMPQIAEPIRIGGATIGCIAARWLPGEGHSGAREMMRLAGAAAAAAVAALNVPPLDPPGPAAPDELLGRGPAAERIRELIRRAASAPYPVLIQGESGSGKELVARAIHARSMRRGRRFCAVNCAAFADDLLEAELFGHVRGAFTGAVGERAGLFEEVDQGTLFLDEVSELSARAQAKLLRVLQEGELRRVGETSVRKIDVRVLAATNRCLEAEVAAGRFRADLRFRLDVLRIDIPPLRERADDVPWLAERIWRETAARVGTRASLAADLLAALARYDWPGNVRELQNVLAAVAVHAPRRGCVRAASLPPHVARLASRSSVTFEAARLDFEQRFVRAALARAGGRQAVAARQLGVSRQGFAKMMKRLGLET